MYVFSDVDDGLARLQMFQIFVFLFKLELNNLNGKIIYLFLKLGVITLEMFLAWKSSW